MTMKAVAPIGRPMAPSSISLRQVWMPAPRNVSGAPPTLRPAFRAAFSTRAPSARVTASGFSRYTCLPAASAASDTDACTFGIVRFSTICTSRSASSSSTVHALATLCFAAAAFARSVTRSAHATTRASRNRRVRFSR